MSKNLQNENNITDLSTTVEPVVDKISNFRTKLNSVSLKKRLTFKEPSMTSQDYKDDCDINFIVANNTPETLQAKINLGAQQAQYLDLSDVGDMLSNMDNIAKNKELFESLPSSERAVYNHDFRQFLSAAVDPANHQHFVDLGLFEGKTTLEYNLEAGRHVKNMVSAEEAQKEIKDKENNA